MTGVSSSEIGPSEALSSTFPMSAYRNYQHCDLNDLPAPPSYEEAINPNAPPPSYDSLFGRVREAQKSSKGVIDFLKNVIVILLGTLGCSIIVGVTIVIPICMIAMGSIYINECPQGEYIPVYLLVGGIFGIAKQLLHLSARVRRTEQERREENLRQSPTQTLLNCFMLGWFIIGSVWVYKEYEPNYDPAFGKYCNKNLYLFAFWLITSVYVLLATMTACLCSISIATFFFHTDATGINRSATHNNNGRGPGQSSVAFELNN